MAPVFLLLGLGLAVGLMNLVGLTLVLLVARFNVRQPLSQAVASLGQLPGLAQ